MGNWKIFYLFLSLHIIIINNRFQKKRFNEYSVFKHPEQLCMVKFRNGMKNNAYVLENCCINEVHD